MNQNLGLSLTGHEINYTRRTLGRAPNPLEWAMIDAEWSEHCSYKSSKPVLRELPTRGRRVLVGPGYDSGVLDLGDGHVISMHVESHNHPSAIDPYGGAATGVGGILRDILCMGTRPIALIDCLRFGRIEKSGHSRWIFRNVVRGIADYGNCTGVPTVAGEVEFDGSFERNCLVDVACIGLGRKRHLVLASATHPDDSVILVGGSTGRDGVHGVTFASKTLTSESDQERSAVQIPDPFVKKLIIDATLEAVETGCVRGLKDLGGGGLTTGLSEMADKGGTGIEVDIANIHVRELDMNPIEIMISESQERMLFIVAKGREDKVCNCFEKYHVPYSKIGKVTATGHLIVLLNAKEIADLPVHFLTHAPIIRRNRKATIKTRARKPKILEDAERAILRVLRSPNISSKRWIYQQYDHEVGVRTVVKPGEADAAVLKLPNGKYLAVKADCNSVYCALDPYTGGASVVAETCRNIVCVGGRPVAMLDHCQFGDPNDPEIFWSFSRAVRGIADACRSLGLPCLGGKVSFYNEDSETGGAIKPSPVIVVAGLIDQARQITKMGFTDAGEDIIVVGKTKRELDGSELYATYEVFGGKPPSLDLKLEQRTQKAILECINRKLVNCCHDCSRGGLIVALAEMCLIKDLGVTIESDRIVAESGISLFELLFSESNSRFLVGTDKTPEVLKTLTRMHIPASVAGRVMESDLEIRRGKTRILVPQVTMREAYLDSLERLMSQ